MSQAACSRGTSPAETGQGSEGPADEMEILPSQAEARVPEAVVVGG